MTTDSMDTLIDAGHHLDRAGLGQGRSGNISLRTETGLLITASGARLDRLTRKDLVAADLSGHWTGPLRPSSELSFHCAVFNARPDAMAIVHVHSPWATSLACMHCPIPAFHYMVAAAGGDDIPCVPYATFGTGALAQAVAGGLQQRNACLMANHGQIALGATMEEALELAEEVENLARCYGQILAIGDPVLLDSEQMADVLERFGGYGKQQPE
ncbi:MAG: class II aldolase/adducin family protein [Pseudohongiellaceae bacterium]